MNVYWPYGVDANVDYPIIAVFPRPSIVPLSVVCQTRLSTKTAIDF